MIPELSEVPPIVRRLADEVGKRPWSWFIADDHITIVFVDGVKQRFSPFLLPPVHTHAASVPPKSPPLSKKEKGSKSPREKESKPRMRVTKLGELSRRKK